MKKAAVQISPIPVTSESNGGVSRYVQLLECIIEVAHNLFKPASLEQSMNQLLAKIGALTGVDQLYFLGIGPAMSVDVASPRKLQSISDLFAWARHSLDGNRCPGDWLKSSFEHSDQHPVWRYLSQGRSLQGTLEAMSADLALCMQQENIYSIVLLPVLQEEHLIGVLGFEHRTSAQDWTEQELSILQQLNQILGAALKQFHLESQLSHYAFHDPLTELPNRALLLNRLDQCIKRKARHSSYSFAVLFLDLDRFKPINDRLGHEVGDHLLIQVAQRIAGCVRPCDTVARLGGDEFVVLLDDISDVTDTESVVGRIRSELTRRFEVDGNDLHVDVSIGIALSSLEFQTGEVILQKADLAMYRAKKSGKGCYRVFEHSMHSQMVQRSETESDMHLALQNKEFDVHYQPIIDLKNGKVRGFEALARWNHPLMGVLEPGRFIPIAEETGMIKILGMQVLRTACLQARYWQETLPSDQTLTMNVNLSAKQFVQKDLLHQILRILNETQIPPETLHLELTESCIIRKDHETLALIRQLQELGIKIYLDDFGAGYSSLQYLNFFPLSGLKIDRMFTQKLHLSPETQAIVRSVIVMAQSLNMDVVVEGIENEQQIQYLQNFTDISGQGFLFAKPLAVGLAQAYVGEYTFELAQGLTRIG